MNLGQMVQKKLQEQNQANVIPTLENPSQKSLLGNVVQNNTPQTIAPQNQPISDYNSYIADAQRQLNEVGKTEGEVKALNDYLSNLQAMQQYVDNQRAEEQRKAQEEQRKQQIAVQKQKEQTQKQAQKSKYEQMIEEAKAFGKQSLNNAKKDDTLASHGYSLSPNEQRDYERAMSAVANQTKKTTETKQNSTEQNLANGMANILTGTITKTPENKVNKQLDTSMLSDMSTKENLQNNPRATQGEAYKFTKEALEKKAKQTTSERMSELANKTRQLTDAEKKEAKELLKQTNNDNPFRTTVNQIFGIGDEQTNDDAKALQTKISKYGSYVSGALDNSLAKTGSELIGRGQIGLLNKFLPDDKKINSDEIMNEVDQVLGSQSAKTENPIAYGVGGAVEKLGENLALYSKGNNLLENVGGKGLLSRIAKGQATDTAIDTIPTLINNAMQGNYSGEDGLKTLGKDFTENQLINLAFNGVAEGIPSVVNALKNAKQTTNAVNNLNPMDMAKQNSDVVENVIKNNDNVAKNVDELQGALNKQEIEEVLNAEPQVNNPKIEAPSIAEDVSTKIQKNQEEIDKLKNLLNSDDDTTVQFATTRINQLENSNANLKKQIEETAQNVVNNAENNPIAETLAKEFPTEQTPEMRINQNAQNVSQVVQPKELTGINSNEYKTSIRDMFDNLDMDEATREVASKEIDNLEKVLDDFNNAQTQDEVMAIMDRFEQSYRNIENTLKGNASYSQIVDTGLKEQKRAFTDSMKGLRINVSDIARGELTDQTIRDLNNAIFGGVNSGRFVKNGGVSVDTVFNEIDQATGNALSRYMIENGLDPSVTENQVKGIVDYGKSLKGSSNQVQTEAYKGGELLNDVLKDMIDNASARGLDIDENALRERMKVSAFRTHNQGQFGLTDEELNNSYFNSQNEHFRFMKGNRDADEERAAKNLAEDYLGTRNKILDKPTTEQFNPQEVDEGFMAYFKELDDARANGNGDYSRPAELMYRLTKDAHDKGSGLQAYVKWKQNSPAGVVLEANSVARDMAQNKVGKDFVNKLDDLVDDIKKVCDSDLSAEEKANQVDELINDLKGKGYLKNLNGAEQMRDLIATGKNVDSVSIQNILYAANKIPNLDVSAQKEIADLAQEMFGKELTREEKQGYIRKINRILSAQKGFSLREKATEISHILMLSGGPTQSRNILANVGMLPQSSLANKVSALGQNAYHLLNPDYKPTQAFKVSKESKKIANDMWDMVGDSLEKGTTGKYTGVTNLGEINADEMFPLKKGKEKNTLSQIPILGQGFSKAKKGIDKIADLVGADGAFDAMSSEKSVMENARQGIYGLLEAGDKPFVKANYVNRLASYIEAQGIKNVADIPQEALDLARNEALKATFKDDNSITKLFQSIKGIPVVGETLLPFTKTPANLLARSFDYGPVGLARSLAGNIKKYGLGKDSRFASNTIGEAIDEIAKGLTGTGASALGVYLYNKGILTGQPSEDTNVANYMSNAGWQKYSISTKGIADFINEQLGTDYDLGDNYVSYSWLQPSTTNLVAGTVLADALEGGNFNDVEGIFNTTKNVFGAYFDSMLSQSTLQDIGDLFDTSYGDGPGANMFDEFMELPTRYFSGAISSAQKLADNNKHETYSKGKPLETLTNTIQSRIPFLSNELPNKYGSFGEELTRASNKNEQIYNALINPAATTHYSDNPLYDLVDSINEKAVDDYVPKKLARSFNLSDDTKYELDNKEYSRLNKVVGDARNELITKLSQTDVFNGADADTQVEALGKIETLATALGKLEVNQDAKISNDVSKLLDIYNNGGSDAFVDYLSQEYNPTTLAIKSSINNKEEGQTKADASLLYLDNTDMTKEEKGKALWDNLDHNKETTALAEKEDYAGIYDFYKKKSKNGEVTTQTTQTKQAEIPTVEKDYYKEWVARENVVESEKTKTIYNEKGSTVAKAYSDLNKLDKNYGSVSSSQSIPYLENNKTLSDDQKGYVLTQVNTIAKGAERAKADVGSDAGIYYYYDYKYNADQKGDKNGSLKKAELISYLTNYEGMSQKEAENIYSKWYKK